MLKPGIYKHFKGNLYKVIGVAKHSETQEDLVVYEPLYENSLSKLCVRPLKMFVEEVKTDSYRGPRFTWVGEKI
jgi:hypothetical protein